MVHVNTKAFDSHKKYMLDQKIKYMLENQLETLVGKDFANPQVVTDHKKGLMKGIRFKDHKRIGDMVLGDIYADCNFNLPDAVDGFERMSATDIEPYIKKNVLDAADSDYYYAFEKVY